MITGQLSTSRAARRDTLGRRGEAITGVSEFPLVGETLLSRPAVAPSAAGGLPRIRWAQWHEELRDRADAHARETGSPPTLILMLLDGSRPSLARAEQVSALLAPVGIAAVVADVDPGTGDADGVAGGLASVVVVCGSAEATAEEVGAAVGRAREQGAATVVVAAGSAEVPGAAEMITDGMDVLAFGDRMLTALGVPR